MRLSSLKRFRWRTSGLWQCGSIGCDPAHTAGLLRRAMRPFDPAGRLSTIRSKWASGSCRWRRGRARRKRRPRLSRLVRAKRREQNGLNPGKDRMDGSAEVDHAALAEKIPLDQIDVSDPALYQQDVWPHYFRRLRRDAPVHYCKESPVGPFWSVTKYRDIVDTEVKHRALSSADGITLAGQAAGHGASHVHRDGPAEARSRAQGGAADRLARQSRQFRGPDPQPRPQAARRPAARGNLQLGGQGLDRTDRPDAGDAVRLSVRGPPQAELLVGLRDRRSLTRAASSKAKSSARRFSASASAISRNCGTSGSTRSRVPTSSRCSRMARRRETWARANISATSSS